MEYINRSNPPQTATAKGNCTNLFEDTYSEISDLLFMNILSYGKDR